MFLHIILCLLVTLIWGFGFVAIRWSLQGLDPFWVNSLRFLIAGLGSLPYLLYKKSFWRKDNILKKSFISSVFLWGVLLFQTWGLQTTTVAKSGFITTLYTFFIPIISMVLFKKKYHISLWVLIGMGLCGMAFLCNLEVKGINGGDLLTLICALFGAAHILYVGRVANSIGSAFEFNFLQNFFIGLLSLPLALVLKGPVDLNILLIQPRILHGLLFLGIVSSMLSFTAQVVAQRKIPAHIAGLIFLMESPFAAFFGHVMFKEVLSDLNLLGAIMIVLAVLLVPILGREVTAEIKPHRGHHH